MPWNARTLPTLFGFKEQTAGRGTELDTGKLGHTGMGLA